MPKFGKLMRYQKSYQFPKTRFCTMHNVFTLFLREYPNGKKVYFYYAYDNEGQRRGLSLHGWRHFVNTDLQRQGLTIQQVQSVTGHKSDRMSEWYSHIDARQIDDVIKAQEAIVGKKQAGGNV
jgi:integrase